MASLEELARKKFADPPLSAAEERVVEHAVKGTEADCRRDLGGGSNPENADGTGEVPDVTWPETRNVRADLIRWVCVDREARELVDAHGVLIAGARITGSLDLSYTNVLFPLYLRGCRLEQDVHLKYAKMPPFSLEGSWTGAIDADGLKLDGDIFLSSGFHSKGGVRLIGATIAGDLDASGGTFENPKKDALNADRAMVTGSVFLSEKFVAEGEVSLVGATIGGDLDAEDATLNNSNGNALSADAIKVTGDIFLTGDFVADGEVRLFSAVIGGNLDAEGGTFRNIKSKKNPDVTGDALSAEGIRVTGDVFLRNRFVADGEVSLLGATIGGDLDAKGGTFKNPKSDKDTGTGDALSADGVKVKGDLSLGGGFNAEGSVRLLGAAIGGNLNADGGTFKNSDGDALIADGIKVTGDVFLNGKFVAEGEVRLLGAEVGGQLEVDDAWLDLLNLDSARVTGPFLWQNIHRQAESHSPNREWKPTLNLTDAKVGPLADQEASWPEKGRLLLDGFVYDRISAGADAKVPTDVKVPVDAAARLRWLGRQPDELGFRPQPYEQLIAVLRRMGHEHQVAKVAIAKQKDLRERGGLGRWGKFWNWFLYRTVRYGYEPWRAFIWMAILLLVGTLAFSLARLPSVRVMVPSDKEAYQPDGKTETVPLPHYYPEFHAFVYSIDFILPFDLGQKSHWRLRENRSGALVYWIFEVYSLFQLFAGWVLLIVAAAVPAGLIKKD